MDGWTIDKRANSQEPLSYTILIHQRYGMGRTFKTPDSEEWKSRSASSSSTVHLSASACYPFIRLYTITIVSPLQCRVSPIPSIHPAASQMRAIINGYPKAAPPPGLRITSPWLEYLGRNPNAQVFA